MAGRAPQAPPKFSTISKLLFFSLPPRSSSKLDHHTFKMTGGKAKGRSHDDQASQPSKRQKTQRSHTGTFIGKDGEDFPAVNLFESDDDDLLNNARADAGTASSNYSSSSEEAPTPRKTQTPKLKKTLPASQPASNASSDQEDLESDLEGDSFSELGDDDDYDDGEGPSLTKKAKKRNDPVAFASSLTKILSTKLSATKRADPVLSRSVAAQKASKDAIDSALEAKARRHIRAEKKAAFEKGRVKDVLVATKSPVTGETEGSTAEILETERRLKKVAQRGVVKLFNAVRAAQVKAAGAEREMRRGGVVGAARKGERITEMSKKGFLDLIASGGGGLKKEGLEEA